MPRVDVPGLGGIRFSVSDSIDQVTQAIYQYMSSKIPMWQKQPREIIPDAFPQAQQRQMQVVPNMPLSDVVADRLGGGMGKPKGANPSPPTWTPEQGWTGPAQITANPEPIRILSPETRAEQYKGFKYLPPKEQTQEMNITALHEAAHSIWDNFSEADKKQWKDIHKKDPTVAGDAYKDDPVHAFAEAYGLYGGDSKRFKIESPEAYKFFLDKSGFEYAPPGSMENK